MKQFGVCAWTIASGPPFTWVKKVKDSRELWWIIKFPKHRQLLKLCEQDLNTSQNNALEFCWILSRQNWEQNLGINPSMLEQPIGQLLRTEVHVFSDFVLCVCNNNAFPNQTWATKLYEVWDSSTLMDSFDITGRPLQFHWHIFSGHTANQIKREIPTFWRSTEPWAESYSRLCSTTSSARDNEQRCLENAKEVTEYAKHIQLGHWCFCGRGQGRVWHRYELGHTSQRMGSHRQENDT